MVVFCAETKANKNVKSFVEQVSNTLSNVNAKNFFFKQTSFIYLVEEKKRYIIIVNLDPVIIPVPRWFAFWVFRKGLNKAGYNEKPILVNNGLVFNIIITRLKQWRKKKY